MSARTFIDTNVLTYVFDDSEPDKQLAARHCLEREQGVHELVISTQVLQELYVSLTKGRHPIATAEVAERAVREASAFTVVQVDVKLVLSAIQRSQHHRLSLWDSLIIGAAVEGRCERLLTEDMNASQIIDSIRVVNPFD